MLGFSRHVNTGGDISVGFSAGTMNAGVAFVGDV